MDEQKNNNTSMTGAGSSIIMRTIGDTDFISISFIPNSGEEFVANIERFDRDKYSCVLGRNLLNYVLFIDGTIFEVKQTDAGIGIRRINNGVGLFKFNINEATLSAGGNAIYAFCIATSDFTIEQSHKFFENIRNAIVRQKP